MNDPVAAFAIGLIFGTCVALAWALHIVERRAKPYKEAEVTMSITPPVANAIGQRLMHDYMERHGLVLVSLETEAKPTGEVLH